VFGAELHLLFDGVFHIAGIALEANFANIRVVTYGIRVLCGGF
jgi:hypothetical protein